MKILLKDFLLYGVLGDINFGMTEEEVLELLGKAELTTPKSKNLILRYSALQLSFRNLIIGSISIHFDRETLFLPKEMKIVGFFPKFGTTITEFKDYLKNENIEYTINELLTFDTQVTLNVGLGVNLIFDSHTSFIYSIHNIKGLTK